MPRLPVLRANAWTPDQAEEASITLAGPPGDAWQAGGACWVHGSLALAPDQDPEEWLRGAFVTIGTEIGPCFVTNLLDDHLLLGDVARDERGRVAFSCDLNARLGVTLAPARYFVRVGARELLSDVLDLRIEEGELDPARVDASLGEGEAETPVQRLIRGAARASAGLRAEALDDYRAALADDALRADLDRGVLAEAAALACAAFAAEGDAALGEEALAWLGEDLDLRRAWLKEHFVAEFEHELEEGPRAERQQRFVAQRNAQLAHFREVRSEGARWEPLRGLPGFAELFPTEAAE